MKKTEMDKKRYNEERNPTIKNARATNSVELRHFYL
jgi:hypothetical protein